MTLWCGLLPCLFLAPVPANEGLKVKADANRMVADALVAEATTLQSGASCLPDLGSFHSQKRSPQAGRRGGFS
jgi:hypothetical protein